MSPALLLVDTSSACVKRFYAVGLTGGTEVREQTALCLDINGGPEETGGLFYQYSGAGYSAFFIIRYPADFQTWHAGYRYPAGYSVIEKAGFPVKYTVTYGTSRSSKPGSGTFLHWTTKMCSR